MLWDSGPLFKLDLVRNTRCEVLGVYEEESVEGLSWQLIDADLPGRASRGSASRTV